MRRDRRDTEIDIYTSRNETEVDIHRHRSRGRDRSPSRERVARPIQSWDDEVLVQADSRRLHVDIERRRSLSRGRRAHSAAPPATHQLDDEAYEITSRIDARGRMGEAWHGITKDWTIIDVPPGTERVRMDGAGGAAADVTWSKYSGVRRAKFVPEREEKASVVSSTTSLSESRGRDRERERRLSVQIVDKDREVEVEKVTDRRIAIRATTPTPPRRSDTWTEITKDLVCREAIEQSGYDFEETEYFYYIVEYLAYVSSPFLPPHAPALSKLHTLTNQKQEDVLRLIQLSERIRAARKERAREIAWEREYRDEWEHRGHHHHHKHRYQVDYDDERVVEREIVYDSRHGGKGYRH